MERLWRHVQCSIPAEVIIMRIAAGLIPMPQPPSFDDKESDYEDLRDELCNLPEDLWCRHIQLPKPQRVFEHLKVQIISSSTFSRPKSSYVVQISLFTLQYHQGNLSNSYQGKALTLEGDARCDSP